MIAVGDLTQQEAINVYVGLLIAWDWRDSALEIMEQLARAIQHPNVEIQADALWNLLAVAGNMKEEFITRVALRRLMVTVEALEDDEQIVDDLLRLTTLLAWSGAARAQLLTWWRGHVRAQTTTRLQRIDKELSDGNETKRSLEDAR